MKNMVHWIVGIALISGAQDVSAQDAESTDAPASAEESELTSWSLEDLLNVTVTASRFEQSELEAPATTTVITSKEIRESGLRTIPDLLATVPGVMVIQSAPGHFTVSIRGMNGLQANNVVVLVDGVRVNQSWDGEVDWGSLPLHPDSLDRIEVVRGPVSVVYGANAYTGVINLITRDSRAPRMSITAAGGADFSGNPGGSASAMSGYAGDIWSVQLGLVTDMDGRLNYEGASENFGEDSYRRTGVNMLNRWDFSPRMSLVLNTAAAYTEGADFSNVIPHPSMRKGVFSDGAATLTVTKLLGKDDTVTLRGTFLGSRTYDSESAEGNEFQLGTVSDVESGVEVSYRSPEFFRNRLLIGASTDFINVENRNLVASLDNNTIRQSGVFASDEINLRPVILTAGVRGDFHPSVPEGKVSYRGSAAYLWQTHVIRASVGSSFRMPTFSEMGARFYNTTASGDQFVALEGNPDLKPPEIFSVELSYQGIIADKLELAPSVFYNHLSNLIYQDFDPIIGKTYDNLGERDIIGTELGLTWLPINALRIALSYTFLQFINPPEDEFTTIGYPGANPAHVANLSILGRMVDNRLSMSLSTLYRSDADYLLQAGIPPEILSHETGHTVSLTPRIGWDIVPEKVDVFIAGTVRLPGSYVESPYIDAASLQSELMLGLTAVH